MHQTFAHSVRSFTLAAAATLFAACADEAPLAPGGQATPAQFEAMPAAETGAVATLRRVTARYQDLNVAIRDSFVLLHPCEVRGDEGPVGAVYYNPGRLMDGVIDPELPDALIYEPGIERSRLVGVEFAVPYALWPQQQPPVFQGVAFQPEDEFGVYALHAWVWLQNPEGLYAETNPRVSCGVE